MKESLNDYAVSILLERNKGLPHTNMEKIDEVCVVCPCLSFCACVCLSGGWGGGYVEGHTCPCLCIAGADVMSCGVNNGRVLRLVFM